MALKETGKRDGFTTKFGLLAALAGSAIGLGNIWRFPYIVGEGGGGAFILVYLGFLFVIGIPVMMSEFIVGRKGGLNAYGSFKKLAPGTRWPLVGVMGIVAAFVILAFYSTIAGWTLHYVYSSFVNAFKGMSSDEVSSMFRQFQGTAWLPLFWQMVFLVLTAIIILLGVKKGIEKYSKILMPFLVLLLIILSIRSITLPGAVEGLTFLFKPDFSKITASVLLSALGQVAFTLSIGMGTLITYASYFPRNTNLKNTAVQVSIADVLVAILAGVAIFPAVFAFGMQPEQGVGLTFIVLPNVFMQMTGGYLLSIAFFVLLAIAALTSAISIMEVVVAFLVEEFNFHRGGATIVTLLSSAFVGVFSTLSWSTFENIKLAGLTIFGILDFAASNIMLPLGGLLILVFVGWYMNKHQVIGEVTNDGAIKFRLFRVFLFIIRFIAPVAIAAVFLRSIGLV